jgi:hypothetical protein
MNETRLARIDRHRAHAPRPEAGSPAFPNGEG